MSPQPDCLLRISDPEHGQTRRSIDGGFIEGAPELIAEIAASSASYDLHSKKNVYRRNGVREYIVWRTLDQAIDWFILHEGEYVLLQAGGDGIHRSIVFPGLWLDFAALLAGEMAKVLSNLQQGIASPEHQAFLEKLKSSDAK
jgi:Uma2 family endonuclease